MFGVTKEDIMCRVQCPWCKNVTGFIDDRPDDIIECLHCGIEIVVSENTVSNSSISGK